MSATFRAYQAVKKPASSKACWRNHTVLIGTFFASIFCMYMWYSITTALGVISEHSTELEDEFHLWEIGLLALAPVYWRSAFGSGSRIGLRATVLATKVGATTALFFTFQKISWFFCTILNQNISKFPTIFYPRTLHFNSPRLLFLTDVIPKKHWPSFINDCWKERDELCLKPCAELGYKFLIISKT